MSSNPIGLIETSEAVEVKSESEDGRLRSPDRLTPVSQGSSSTRPQRRSNREIRQGDISHGQRTRRDSWRPTDSQRNGPDWFGVVHSLGSGALVAHALQKSSCVSDMFMLEPGISEQEFSRLKTTFTNIFKIEDLSVSNLIKRIDRAIIGKFASREQPPCLLARLFSKRFLYFEKNGSLVTECDACPDNWPCLWAEHMPQVDTGFLARDAFGRVPSRADRRVPGSDKDWILPKVDLTQFVGGKEVRWALRRFSMRQRLKAAPVAELNY